MRPKLAFIAYRRKGTGHSGLKKSIGGSYRATQRLCNRRRMTLQAKFEEERVDPTRRKNNFL
jgi:hypothetical protein